MLGHADRFFSSPPPKVVLCFSPVGSTLRVRGRKFPAITNCTAIDWFHEWPEEALVSVSRKFIDDCEQLTVRARDFSGFLLLGVHCRYAGDKKRKSKRESSEEGK